MTGNSYLEIRRYLPDVLNCMPFVHTVTNTRALSVHKLIGTLTSNERVPLRKVGVVWCRIFVSGTISLAVSVIRWIGSYGK